MSSHNHIICFVIQHSMFEIRFSTYHNFSISAFRCSGLCGTGLIFSVRFLVFGVRLSKAQQKSQRKKHIGNTLRTMPKSHNIFPNRHKKRHEENVRMPDESDDYTPNERLYKRGRDDTDSAQMILSEACTNKHTHTHTEQMIAS